MTFNNAEELENVLIELINKIDINCYDFDNSKEIDNSVYSFKENCSKLKFFFKKSSGETGIEFIHNLLIDRLYLQIDYTDDFDEDEDFVHLFGEIRIPRTEEQYFQYYTIQDNVFSLKFYQILDNKLSELLVKWQSLA